MRINIDSGIGASSVDCLGQILMLDLENGWGWYKRVGGDATDVEMEVFYNKSARFRLVELLWFSGIVRGFRGILIGDCSETLGKGVIGISLSDGFDYDFDKSPCACWRLCFGDCDYSLSEQGDLEFLGDCVLGWGRDTRIDK